MATFNKFEAFSEHLAEKVHDLNADTLKVYLTNNAPDAAADAVKADLVESVAGGNGYTAGGHDTQNATSRAAGVTSVTGVDITITASGGTIGPFRYAVVYNDTPAAGVVDPLIGYYDYGSSITLADGENILVDFGASIFTVT
jgi:hypothetical protein